jgi:hypothetical protein
MVLDCVMKCINGRQNALLEDDAETTLRPLVSSAKSACFVAFNLSRSMRDLPSGKPLQC